MLNPFNKPHSLLKHFVYKSTNKRTNLLVKQIVSGFGIKTLSVIFYLIYIPIVLGYLDSEKYGIWITLTTMVNWIGLLDIGLGNGLRTKLSEKIAKDKYDEGRIYVSTTYFILIFIFGAFLIFFHIVNPFIPWQNILNSTLISAKELYLLTSVVITFLIFRFVVQIVAVIHGAHGNSVFGDLINLVSNILSLILIWAIVRFGEKGNLLLLASIIAIVPVVVYTFFSIYTFLKKYPNLSPSYRWVDFSFSKSLIGLSSQFFIVQISATILYASAPFIISSLFNPNEATTYSVVSTVFYMPILLISVISTPVVPLVTNAVTRRDGDWLRNTLKRLMKISLLVAVGTIILIIFSDLIFKVWLGNKITIPFNLTVAIGVYTIISIINYPLSNFYNGIGKMRILTFFAPIQLGVFLFFSWFLTERLKNVVAIPIALSLSSLITFFIFPRAIFKTIKNSL
jgi:O-antigen/teichoic acid export membrane protein